MFQHQGSKGVQFKYQEGFVPTAVEQKWYIYHIKRVMFQQQLDKMGIDPISTGLCSNYRGAKELQFQHDGGCIPASGGQKGFNSNIKRNMFQQQLGKIGTDPTSRWLCFNSTGTQGVQFQYQKGFVPRVGEQKWYNYNIKRVYQEGYVPTAIGQNGYRSNIKRAMFQLQGDKNVTIPT